MYLLNDEIINCASIISFFLLDALCNFAFVFVLSITM